MAGAVILKGVEGVEIGLMWNAAGRLSAPTAMQIGNVIDQASGMPALS